MAKCKTLLGFGVNDYDKTVKWKLSCGKEFSLPEYSLWKGMICRCYGKVNKANESYLNTKVCDSWRSLKEFSKWFDEQHYEVGFVLDKDLLGDGSLYSKDTCCLLPKEVNGFMINNKKSRGYHVRGNIFEACSSENSKYVYLGSFNNKEDAIKSYLDYKSAKAKSLAEKWKDKIDVRAYTALMNYKIDIGD